MTSLYTKQLLIVVAIAVLTALIAKSQVQLPVIKQQQPKEVMLSTLIAQQKQTAQQAHKKLSKRFLVKQNSAQGSQKKSDWQLHGIIKTGEYYFALIKQQAKIARYQVGDTLLDDSTITAIHANGISASTTEQRQEYRLYQE
jgi:hypothetical protein